MEIPSLTELVDKHGLIAGSGDDIYFGDDAAKFVRDSIQRDKQGGFFDLDER